MYDSPSARLPSTESDATASPCGVFRQPKSAMTATSAATPERLLPRTLGAREGARGERCEPWGKGSAERIGTGAFGRLRYSGCITGGQEDKPMHAKFTSISLGLGTAALALLLNHPARAQNTVVVATPVHAESTSSIPNRALLGTGAGALFIGYV